MSHHFLTQLKAYMHNAIPPRMHDAESQTSHVPRPTLSIKCHMIIAWRASILFCNSVPEHWEWLSSLFLPYRQWIRRQATMDEDYDVIVLGTGLKVSYMVTRVDFDPAGTRTRVLRTVIGTCINSCYVHLTIQFLPWCDATAQHGVSVP